jgi:hypothetical protein
MILSLPLLLIGCDSASKSSEPGGIEPVQPIAELHPETTGNQGVYGEDERIFISADGREIPGSRYTPTPSFSSE